jgi:hypothetical protein
MRRNIAHQGQPFLPYTDAIRGFVYEIEADKPREVTSAERELR